MSVVLRPLKNDDLNQLVSLANNFNIAKFLTNKFPHPYTMEHALLLFESSIKENPVRILAITKDDLLIGMAGVHLQEDIFSNNAEIGYWIGEPFWGQGYMTEALNKITEYGFLNFNINRLYCRVFGNNPKSMRVLEKVNFKLEAKLDKTLVKNDEVLDEYIYAKRRP